MDSTVQKYFVFKKFFCLFLKRCIKKHFYLLTSEKVQETTDDEIKVKPDVSILCFFSSITSLSLLLGYEVLWFSLFVYVCKSLPSQPLLSPNFP